MDRTTYFRFFIALNLLYCNFLKFLRVTDEWNPAVRARGWIQPLWPKKPKLANIKLLSLTYYSFTWFYSSSRRNTLLVVLLLDFHTSVTEYNNNFRLIFTFYFISFPARSLAILTRDSFEAPWKKEHQISYGHCFCNFVW